MSAAVTWDDVVQLQQDVRILQLALDSIQKRLDELLARFKKQGEVMEVATPPRRFSDLKGIWKGADFSYEEIEAALYKEPEDWWL